MAKRFTIPISINASAGSDTKHELYEVAEAEVKASEIELAFESGVFNVLFASLYYGDMKVAPKQGEYTGDGGRLRDKIDVTYYRGDKVLLRVRNTDAVSAHYLSGSIEFEVVR